VIRGGFVIGVASVIWPRCRADGAAWTLAEDPSKVMLDKLLKRRHSVLGQHVQAMSRHRRAHVRLLQMPWCHDPTGCAEAPGLDASCWRVDRCR